MPGLPAGRALTAFDVVHKMSNVEDTLSRRLELITLPDCEGRELRLGTLWERQPAVVVFLRHYG